MPEIYDDLITEPLPEVDYNAPEMGSFAPLLYPGTYPFIFNLPEQSDQQFTVKLVKGANHFEVNFIAAIPVHEVKPEQFVASKLPEDREYINVTFQRANTYRSEKMVNSFLGELLRSIKVVVTPLTPQNIVNQLRAASGKVRGLAEFKWRVYCKNCSVEISTAPRKKQGDVPWSKGSDGKFELQAHCPSCGTGYYGQEEISRYRLSSV